jgi:hypothetical protein
VIDVAIPDEVFPPATDSQQSGGDRGDGGKGCPDNIHISPRQKQHDWYGGGEDERNGLNTIALSVILFFPPQILIDQAVTAVKGYLTWCLSFFWKFGTVHVMHLCGLAF